MKHLYGNAVVGQSGGPTAAINATLAGVISGAMKSKLIDNASMSVSMLAPVVVKPDTVSKKASTGSGIWPLISRMVYA